MWQDMKQNSYWQILASSLESCPTSSVCSLYKALLPPISYVQQQGCGDPGPQLCIPPLSLVEQGMKAYCAQVPHTNCNPGTGPASSTERA